MDQPKLTLEQVRAYANEKSFKRGEAYYWDDAIFDTVKRGNTLEALCAAGSQPEPYRVTATLGENGVVEATCTCRYEYAGACKHVVALLLTYVRRTQSFEERSAVADTLNARSKDELVALVRQMLTRYPDLQALVDRPLPGKATGSIDLSPIRKELRRALNHYHEWGDHTAERTVVSIAENAQAFAARGDWRSASAIYRAIIEECTSENDYNMPDDDGDFVVAVNGVIEQLAACLDQRALADNDEARRAILDTLLNAYLWDSDQGGYGFGDEVPDLILRYARQSDLAGIQQHIHAARERKKKGRYGNWMVEGLTEFLIEFEALDNVDPEITLARLREEGMYNVLIGKLIELKRLDEAVQVVEQHIANPSERLRELSRLSAAGRTPDAVRLAMETLRKTYDHLLTDWLLAMLQAQGNHEAVFSWQTVRMQHEPDVPHYVQLKAAASEVGKWDETRAETLRYLEKERRFDVLARIYLHEEDWERAWSTYEKGKKEGKGYVYSGLELEVAAKSRFAQPQRALPVYVRAARHRIEQRTRDDYHQAAEYLTVVRDLHERLNDVDRWKHLIDGIRREFKQLPALQDELRKAKL